MKKFFLVAVLAIASVSFMNAQDNKARAIGGNIGTSLGFSYQHSLNSGMNMIDCDVNIPFLLGTYGIGAHVTYDWINPFNTSIPWNHKGEWNWAMGAGVSGGIYGFRDITWHVGAAGHIGVAYNFWFPLELSIDWRPEVGVFGSGRTVAFGWPGLLGFQVGVRYLL